MSLLTAWSAFFQSRSRIAGRGLQNQGKVQRVEPSEQELIRASVGSNNGDDTIHTVILRREGKQVGAECTCESFGQGTLCEHIWATLLDVQANEGPGADAQSLWGMKVAPPRAKKRDPNAASTSVNREPNWVGRVALLHPGQSDAVANVDETIPVHRQINFVVRPRLSVRHNGLVVELRQRTAIATGWSKAKPIRISNSSIENLPDADDRKIAAVLLGATHVNEQDAFDSTGLSRGQSMFRLPPGGCRDLLKQMTATGRCAVANQDDPHQERPLSWLGDEPWVAYMVATEQGDDLQISLELRRQGKRLPIAEPDLVLPGFDGIVIHNNAVAPLDDRDAPRWIHQFRQDRFSDQPRSFTVPAPDVQRFLDQLYLLPQLPELDLPDQLQRAEHTVVPTPILALHSPGSSKAQRNLPSSSKSQLLVELSFDYAGVRVESGQQGRFISVDLPDDQTDSAEADSQQQGESKDQAAATTPTSANGEDSDLSQLSPELLDDLPDDMRPDGLASDDSQPDADHGSRLVRRDRRSERGAFSTLAHLGVRSVGSAESSAMALPAKRMSAIVSSLLAQGWRVQADQLLVRSAGPPRLSVKSGIDWFELHGSMTFEGEDGRSYDVPLPDILAAARKGQAMIELDDGSHGLLPERWLEEHGLLTTIGQLEQEHLRFSTSQAAILDAMLDEPDIADVDEKFARARKQLREFEKIEPVDADDHFLGDLRQYQKNGLGWLTFLRQFGVGGILADDMGLGKTIQVLAMLAARRHEHPVHGSDLLDIPLDDRHRPTLIAAPKSVVFNWIDEAQRFTPSLRTAVYTGPDREQTLASIDDIDVLITSYGMIRRDAQRLAEQQFDYVVLDEAQAIKNPASQGARAVRLLKARHRLVLTGTPIENHLGDLWSIFEFLNPGLLGSNLRFAEMVRAASTKRIRLSEPDTKTPDAAASPTGATSKSKRDEGQVVQQVGKALRPFILRRTKQQVLADLPEKTEQVIHCEMDDGQQKVYDDLRRYYQGQLVGRLETSGGSSTALGRNAFVVLEALLRLRQAACHPALIDPSQEQIGSAKLDALDEMLEDILDEGAKALVFSQFTSMLSLVKKRFDARGIGYSYLDGQTRHRKQVVDEFQNDPDKQVFLISLKAGGFGLNLTAAEYVFILDPWWNPAVEAQAIDRTHRIGQTRPVFAYRMVCRGTVEQRILELQQRKRDLAQAVIGQEGNLLGSLTREEIEHLFG